MMSSCRSMPLWALLILLLNFTAGCGGVSTDPGPLGPKSASSDYGSDGVLPGGTDGGGSTGGGGTGGGSGGGGGTAGTITGSWQGTFNAGSHGTFTMTMTVNSSSSTHFTGSYVWQSGVKGQVDATVHEKNAQITFTEPQLTINFTGQVNADNSEISGTATGTDGLEGTVTFVKNGGGGGGGTSGTVSGAWNGTWQTNINSSAMEPMTFSATSDGSITGKLNGNIPFTGTLTLSGTTLSGSITFAGGFNCNVEGSLLKTGSQETIEGTYGTPGLNGRGNMKFTKVSGGLQTVNQ